MAGGRERKRKRKAAAVLMVLDPDFLDCNICYLALKPPIFQCANGHVVCSPCGDKLKDAAACCGVAMDGGYRGCNAMERVVESIRSTCPHAAYGCDATPAYHAREDHLRECPHAPCHCPGEACSFVGSTAALLDHVAGEHGWRCFVAPPVRQPPGSPTLGASLYLELREGFQFVVSGDADEHGRKYVFLLNVVHHQFCRAVSVLCIRPRAAAAAAKEINFQLRFKLNGDEGHPLARHTQTTVFEVGCSDLCDGLPDPNENFQLIVPKYVHRDRGDMLFEAWFGIE
ncbi:hypothetical protein BS78_09G050200 [Paspalum vaginatum]|nr:hypothetical protein BS78_09G050200 [Paspalum vaginatum]KAJ1261694.1 hypothetical protein BS78_09G050200 [Paspalum vaginatum]